MAPIIVAEASQAKSAAMERTIGVCSVIGNASWEPSAEHGVSAYATAKEYFRQREHRKVDFPLSKMTVIQKPQHGVLREIDGGGYYYIADADWIKQQMHGDIRTSYLGKDRAVILVEMGGFKIKMVYFFHVLNSGADNASDELCGTKGRVWKISQSDSTFAALLNNADKLTTFAGMDFAPLIVR